MFSKVGVILSIWGGYGFMEWLSYGISLVGNDHFGDTKRQGA